MPVSGVPLTSKHYSLPLLYLSRPHSTSSRLQVLAAIQISNPKEGGLGNSLAGLLNQVV